MTPPIVIELGYQGIIIPQQTRHARIPCPKCSHTRRNPRKRCMVVKVKSDTRAEVICHHCDGVWREVRV